VHEYPGRERERECTWSSPHTRGEGRAPSHFILSPVTRERTSRSPFSETCSAALCSASFVSTLPLLFLCELQQLLPRLHLHFTLRGFNTPLKPDTTPTYSTLLYSTLPLETLKRCHGLKDIIRIHVLRSSRHRILLHAERASERVSE
jgi:hypothetical protein